MRSSGDQMKSEMSMVCSTHGGEERFIQGFGGETGGKDATWKTQE